MSSESSQANAITPAEKARYHELQLIALDAARAGDVELLKPMLDAGLPVDLADSKGNTLLMLAAYYGEAAMVRFLLDHGAKPDQRNDRGQTPLSGVAFKGKLEVVKLLIERGADPAIDLGGGRRAVHFAAYFGHTEIVRYLESLSAKPPSRGLLLLSRFTVPLRWLVTGLRKVMPRRKRRG